MWQCVWPYKLLRLSHAQSSTTTTMYHRLHSPVKVNVVDITFHIICHISLVICHSSSISSTSPSPPYEITTFVLYFHHIFIYISSITFNHINITPFPPTTFAHIHTAHSSPFTFSYTSLCHTSSHHAWYASTRGRGPGIRICNSQSPGSV